MSRARVFTALHLFCGIGGGTLGFAAARARLGGLDGRIENIGGIDCDPMALEDYTRLTGTPGTVLNLFTADDYRDFHGEPPPGWEDQSGRLVPVAPDAWREATPDDIVAACGGRAPDIIFLSPPCRSFSGLLPRGRTGEAKYRALSRLVCRGLFLVMEAFKADPPRLIILENVPRIEQRGADLIDRNISLLQSYGYATQTTVHDCGEIGGLAAHRRRFLLVARHTAKVRPFLYEPPKRELRPLGDEILRLPLPFDPAAGEMHTLPKLEHKTWLRLALIPPGGDWRDLQRWAPGTFAVSRTPFNNVYQVLELGEAAPTVTSGATPTSGGPAVPDPRLSDRPHRHTTKFQVGDPAAPARTVTGTMDVHAGAMSAVDPRMAFRAGRHTNKLQVNDPAAPARTVTGARLGSGTISAPDVRMSLPDKSVTLRVRAVERPAATIPSRSSVWDSGGQSVPDPRVPGEYHRGTYGVQTLDSPSGTITGGARASTGAFALPEVRVGRAFESTYGVADPAAPSATITGKAQPTTGRYSLPEPRVAEVRPAFWPEWVPVIISPHTGCMHRPLTTLELFALQGFLEVLGFDPTSPPRLATRTTRATHSHWRTRIGNAVPPPAARAVAETMLMTLLADEQAQLVLPTTPVWVSPPDDCLNRVLRELAPERYEGEAAA